MTRHSFTLFTAAIALIVCAAAGLAGDTRRDGAAASPGPFDLSWHTIDGGGGTSTGGTPENEFTLSGTIGQPDAGVMSGGSFTLAGGFWPGATAGPGGPSCIGDLNNSGAVDVQDLLMLLSAWGPCENPGNPVGCPADLNNSGAVDVQDLLILLGAWGVCP